jgi:hypothetical protein
MLMLEGKHRVIFLHVCIYFCSSSSGFWQGLSDPGYRMMREVTAITIIMLVFLIINLICAYLMSSYEKMGEK